MNRRQDRFHNPYQNFSTNYAGKHKAVSASYEMFTPPRRNWKPLLAVLILLALLIGGGFGYSVIESRLVFVNEVTVPIPNLPKAFEGYTILHISDLYGARFGEKQRRIADALEGKSYSVVCITGDMLGPTEDPQPFYELLTALGEKRPVLFITGENDPDPFEGEQSLADNVLAPFILGAQQRSAIYLDAPYCVELGGERLWFAPDSALSLDLDAAEQTYRAQGSRATGAVQKKVIDYQLGRIDRIRQARETMQSSDTYVALSHMPLKQSFVRGMTTTRTDPQQTTLIGMIDLVLAGHYNGGQVRLPFAGPLYVSGYGLFPGEGVVEGLVTSGTLPQHISPGLGVKPDTLLPMRLFNPPTMTLVKLTASL